MINLTAQQIADAKNNDLAAVTAVIEATEERVTQHANRYAMVAGRVNPELAEDLAQVGRITVWESIAKFGGVDVAQFFAYIDQRITGALSHERRTETRQGVHYKVAQTFEDCLSRAAGDPYEAEKLATSASLGDRRLSKDNAYGARLSWQGSDSLDRQVSDDGDSTVGSMIASEIGIPEAFLTEKDITSHQRRTVRTQVHATLTKLSGRMATVLRQDYGIGDVPYYGDVVAAADDEMAKDMGISPNQVQQARTRGKARFRELYLKGSTVTAESR